MHMKILLINGSPRLERSNSLRIAKAFVEGIREVTDAEVKQLDVSAMNIKPCKGCFGCWKVTPGKCVQTGDDMEQAIEDFKAADILLWSFPLYAYEMPGTLKVFLDRLNPLNKPYVLDRFDGNGCGTHEATYDNSRQRHVLISTCGQFSCKGNYDAIVKHFDLKYGNKLRTTIFCGEGELFPIPYYADKVNHYLSVVRRAGNEFGKTGSIFYDTAMELDKLIIPKEEYVNMANSYYAHMAKKAAQREAEKQNAPAEPGKA